MHEARLKGILVQTPTVYQVTEGLKEKAPLVEIMRFRAAFGSSLSMSSGGRNRGSILAIAELKYHFKFLGESPVEARVFE